MPHRTGAPDRSPERLVRDYADLVLRVCYTYLRTTADAEDVCQDTLLKLICREEPFNGSDHERMGHPAWHRTPAELTGASRCPPRGGAFVGARARSGT